MRKFHINSNGDVKPCKATQNRCQFGDESLHFADEVAARKAVEKILEDSNGDAHVLLGKKKDISEITARKDDPSWRPSAGFLHSRTEPSILKRKARIRMGGKSFPILERDDMSGYICNKCERQLTLEEESTILAWESGSCSYCGEDFQFPNIQKMGMLPASAWLLDKKHYKDNLLYHVTTKSQWRKEIAGKPDLPIHMGDRLATAYRANDHYMQDHKGEISGFYRYAIRLKTDAKETKILLSEDLEDSWESISAEGKFIVYLNRWEHPGSLSVMVNQEHMEIIGEPETLTIDDIYKELK